MKLIKSLLIRKKMINSSDFCLVSKYKSKNNELGHLPSAPNMSIPSFTPNQIDKNGIYKMLMTMIVMVVMMIMMRMMTDY